MGNSRDWQKEIYEMFGGMEGRYILFNPRQENWDASRPGEMDYQVRWELEHLEEADMIVFNTCCIRENAENHAFGNIGALKKLKKQKPDLVIAVGGCMTQEKGMPEQIKEKFPFVDIVFGTLNLEELETLMAFME